MCGRFVIDDESDIEEINKIIADISAKYSGSGIAAKTGEVFPANLVTVLALENRKPVLSIMQWGFPKWDGNGVIINARSETAEEKNSFAKAFNERRCVIPATGFYEWSRDGKGKTKDKYLFNAETDSMLYMAGIYTDYSKSIRNNSGIGDNGQISARFVILTQPANETISDIHDRMPALLRKHELISWLSDCGFARYTLRRRGLELTRKPA